MSYYKTVSIPTGMLTRKFYCHRCGTQLGRVSRTRIVKRGDPDFKKHTPSGRIILNSEIEVKEYDFRCPDCGNITGYDDQCVIEYIQHRTGSRMLSRQQVAENTQEAKHCLDRKKKQMSLIGTIICTAITLAALLINWLR